MAKAAWSTVTPASGSAGTTPVQVGGSVHTGRASRPTSPVFKIGTAASATLTGTQEAAGNIFQLAQNLAVTKEGGTALPFEGISNAQKLNVVVAGTGFTFNGLQISIDDGATWTAKLANNINFEGDPGVTAAYKFRILISATANPTTATRSGTITITPTPGAALPVRTITQAAGDAAVSISPTSITIPADGTAQTVNVTANADWTVE
ncbi:MAG: hypothetical protein LBP72_01145 [Dysgonamonadaceae bacterium]|jgi:hypothetical protein|nr:hypothetical protein [Dysgonamonadaceae bacterium]